MKSLLCISFSNILSRFERSDIALLIKTLRFQGFLRINLSTFHMSGNTSVVKNRLKASAKCAVILLFRGWIIYVGILFRQDDLQLLGEEIIFDISLTAVGAIMNDSKILGGTKSSMTYLKTLFLLEQIVQRKQKIVELTCKINRFCDEWAIMIYWCMNIIVLRLQRNNWCGTFLCFFNVINIVFKMIAEKFLFWVFQEDRDYRD